MFFSQNSQKIKKTVPKFLLDKVVVPQPKTVTLLPNDGRRNRFTEE